MTATASHQNSTTRRAEAHLWPHFSRLSAFQTDSVPVISRGSSLRRIPEPKILVLIGQFPAMTEAASRTARTMF